MGKYKNINHVPKVTKVTLNCVTRDCVSNGKIVDSIKNDLSLISGQRAVTARAKKSIASFKLREGQAIGAYVTLRGHKMYEFLERLIALALPRVRDFRGINPNGMDG